MPISRCLGMHCLFLYSSQYHSYSSQKEHRIRGCNVRNIQHYEALVSAYSHHPYIGLGILLTQGEYDFRCRRTSLHPGSTLVEQ